MTSLFVLSLPRSMSTFTFRVCRDALGLKQPSWAENGEILNHEMLALSQWPKLADEAHKYLTSEGDPVRFARVTEFLDTLANPAGYIYRDVVNPFNRETLKAAFRDLDEAARLVKDRAVYRERVDQMRAYACLLYLMQRRDVNGSYQWVNRLRTTNMVHTWGWNILAARGKSWGKPSKDARKRGTTPARAEIEAKFIEAKRALGL